MTRSARWRRRHRGWPAGPTPARGSSGGGRPPRGPVRPSWSPAPPPAPPPSSFEGLGDGVRGEVDPDHKGGDRKRREEHRPPQTSGDESVVVEDAESPIRRRRLDPEAPEGQRDDREDRVAEPDGELDQDWRKDVREQLDEHDVGSVLLGKLRRLDVLLPPLRQHGGSHRAGDDGGEYDADYQDHGQGRGTQRDPEKKAEEHQEQGKNGIQ